MDGCRGSTFSGNERCVGDETDGADSGGQQFDGCRRSAVSGGECSAGGGTDDTDPGGQQCELLSSRKNFDKSGGYSISIDSTESSTHSNG